MALQILIAASSGVPASGIAAINLKSKSSLADNELLTDCIPLYSAKSERSALCHFPWVSLSAPKWSCESVQSNIVNLQVSDDSKLTQ
jgi:hypothetical protein